MASIQELSAIISKIANGIETQILDCMDSHKDEILRCISEQIYSGLDSEGEYLNPDYDNDPFFEEKGEWYHRAKDYKAMKLAITPPASGPLLGLPPRSENVPNLWINGKFHSSIFVSRTGNEMKTDVRGDTDAPSIVAKWGDEIINLGMTAKEYFNETHLRPFLNDFFNKSGYR